MHSAIERERERNDELRKRLECIQNTRQIVDIIFIGLSESENEPIGMDTTNVQDSFL